MITNKFSPVARCQKESIFKRFGGKYKNPKDLKNIRNGFKRLIKIGLIIEHPSKGMTYTVSKEAVMMVLDLLEKLEKLD